MADGEATAIIVGTSAVDPLAAVSAASRTAGGVVIPLDTSTAGGAIEFKGEGEGKEKARGLTESAEEKYIEEKIKPE